MKKLKLVVLLILMLVIAACGGNNDGATADPDTNTDPDTTEEADGVEGEEEEEEGADYYQTPEMDFDLGGRTLKVVAWWDMEITGEDPDSVQARENLEELKEKHNFDIEYIAIDFGEYQERITASLLANEPIGDYIRVGKKYTIPSFAQQDLIWAIDDYVQNPNVFNLPYTHEIFQHEGQGYAFTDARANIVQGIFYNRTLMGELGLKPIQEYVDEDNWNWDTFAEVVASANQDTDNDGNIDTWGLAVPSVLERALAANDAALTDADQQTLDDPATIEALEFTQDIFEIARPTEGGDWTEPEQFFRQGNTLFMPGADFMYNGIVNDMPDYDIGFVPFPIGPSADGYRTFEADIQAIAIPKAVDNPEQLIYIWEKIFDIESIYDYPGQANLESMFSNEDDIENARLVQQQLNVLDHFTFDNDVFWSFQAELLDGVPVSTLIESHAPAFQAAIDDVYGN
ncbi:ABC transporter substrate-binding protein [Amphibacillus indicireducens]|uniref:Extracellular solute-binding protein n=1 Tax=Amphibacillus indicireducens TaxID=1076330 RepID=A0ABP7V9M4_9BACI